MRRATRRRRVEGSMLVISARSACRCRRRFARMARTRQSLMLRPRALRPVAEKLAARAAPTRLIRKGRKFSRRMVFVCAADRPAPNTDDAVSYEAVIGASKGSASLAARNRLARANSGSTGRGWRGCPIRDSGPPKLGSGPLSRGKRTGLWAKTAAPRTFAVRTGRPEKPSLEGTIALSGVRWAPNYWPSRYPCRVHNHIAND